MEVTHPGACYEMGGGVTCRHDGWEHLQAWGDVRKALNAGRPVLDRDGDFIVQIRVSQNDGRAAVTYVSRGGFARITSQECEPGGVVEYDKETLKQLRENKGWRNPLGQQPPEYAQSLRTPVQAEPLSEKELKELYRRLGVRA